MTTKFTREEWLLVAAEEIRFALAGLVEVPTDVQVSCSWPGGGSPAKRIGECWPRAASKAGVNEVFVSPKIEDGLKVVGILAHELAHAVDNCKNGHRAPFVHIAKRMFLEGKPTQMMPDALHAQAWLTATEKRVGRYPHRVLDKAKSGQKKQTTRMVKLSCGDCGAIFRMSQSVIETAQGMLLCPCCHADAVAVG
jgi:hypothetical protein